MPPETETKHRASGADLIAQAKAGIEEVQPLEAAAEIDQGDVAMVDVRELTEFEERHIEGAIHVPRSYLEQRIEQYVPDRSKRVITYCGGGIAASSDAFVLTRLGYEDVAVYTASLQEWAADPANPLVTG